MNIEAIKSIYVYSRPEWTALVTTPTTGIKTVADLELMTGLTNLLPVDADMARSHPLLREAA